MELLQLHGGASSRGAANASRPQDIEILNSKTHPSLSLKEKKCFVQHIDQGWDCWLCFAPGSMAILRESRPDARQSSTAWSSNTYMSNGDTLVLQDDDGDLVLYAPGGIPVWAC